MSFRCDYCGEPQEPKTKPIKLVVQTRRKIYPVRYEEDGKTVLDSGGSGLEIVKEFNLCKDCYELLTTTVIIA